MCNSMKIAQQTSNEMQGNFLNKTMQEIDESIEKMYDREKLKW